MFIKIFAVLYLAENVLHGGPGGLQRLDLRLNLGMVVQGAHALAVMPHEGPKRLLRYEPPNTGVESPAERMDRQPSALGVDR